MNSRCSITANDNGRDFVAYHKGPLTIGAACIALRDQGRRIVPVLGGWL